MPKTDSEKVKLLLLEQAEMDQILGRALHFPPYPEDWPGADGDVCTGEYTVVDLAMLAAKRIAELEAEVARLREEA